MENMADALKISFAILVFVVAIAITFSMMSKAKVTSDVVLYHADKTNFYNYEDSKEKNRKVGMSDIICTLYKSTEESIVVSIIGREGKPFNVVYNGAIISQLSADEKLINEFIKCNKSNIEGLTYIEDFIEVPYSGEYKIADDGTQITIQNGGKTVYITYYEESYYDSFIKPIREG